MVARARQLGEICAVHGVALTAAALQFSTAHPAVSHVLTGVRSVEELRSNLADFERPIPPALWADLRAQRLLDDRVPTP
jgi:D-threo-aldose 1-dehydrogenase